MSGGSPSTEMLEDKKCRICGFANRENIHIFTGNDKNLKRKICTVYPFIVLYRNDPLPKTVCKKCVTSVNTMFNDIQNVANLQNIWIQNVRINQPKNDYVQALNLLKNSSEAVRKVMHSSFSKHTFDAAINRLLVNAINEVANQKGDKGNPIAVIEKKINENVTLNYEIKSSKRKRRHRSPKTMNIKEEEEDNVALSTIASNKICHSSLTSPSPPVKCRYCPLVFDTMKQLYLHQTVHLNICIPKIFQNKCLSRNLRRGRLMSTKNNQSIRCLNCWQVFADNKCILEHWANGECDYYCTICGMDFLHAPKMLRDHISDVHGLNYKSLKSKRDQFISKWPTSCKSRDDADMDDFQGFEDSLEHSARELTQDMIKAESTAVDDQESQTLSTPESPNTENFVKCRVCSRLFQNFKACNSHMRAHKPPYDYNDITSLPKAHAVSCSGTIKTKLEKPPTPPPDLTPPKVESTTPPATNTVPIIATANSTGILLKTEADPLIGTNIDANSSSSNSSSTNPANPSPTNAVSKTTTSTAPRGIRMKFVTRRSDLNGMLPSIKVKSLSDLQGYQRNTTQNNPPPALPIDRVQNPLSTQHSMPSEISYDALNVKQNPNYFRFT